MNKPFWTSRKFIYSIAMLIALIILAVLPSALADAGFTLDPESEAALNETLPGVVIVFALVITGHTIQDALTTAKGAQPTTIREQLMELLNQIPLETMLGKEAAPLAESAPPELRKTYMPGASPTYVKPSAPEDSAGHLGGATK